MLRRPPDSNRAATIRIGIAQEVSISSPKTTFPVIAPRRAIAKLTAIAVDLEREKYSFFLSFSLGFRVMGK